MSSPRVVVLGRPACHLCDEAHAVVEAVCGPLGIAWEERSLLDDPALEARYRNDIPVIFVDGVQHSRWKVQPERLRAALGAAGPA